MSWTLPFVGEGSRIACPASYGFIGLQSLPRRWSCHHLAGTCCQVYRLLNHGFLGEATLLQPAVQVTSLPLASVCVGKAYKGDRQKPYKIYKNMFSDLSLLLSQYYHKVSPCVAFVGRGRMHLD